MQRVKYFSRVNSVRVVFGFPDGGDFESVTQYENSYILWHCAHYGLSMIFACDYVDASKYFPVCRYLSWESVQVVSFRLDFIYG
ncbi:hypothetical protein D3C78_1391710 [compost metagenome]